jgi:hypothetical protein
MASGHQEQELHHLRSLLTPRTSLRMKDPDLVDKEKDNTPPIATPTKGPHRMTFVVPHDDESVLNVGKADPGAHRINETGITGMTKSHIHWQTTEEPKTILSLGKPAPSLTVASSHGNLIASIKGHGLFTEANSWQDAKEQFYMVSRTEDISMRTMGKQKVATVQSDTGKALVFGGDNATIASPKGVVIGSGSDMKLQDVDLEEKWTDKWRQDAYAKIGQAINTVGELGTSALSIFQSISKTKTVGTEGKTGPGTRPRVGSKAKLIADLGLFVSSVVHGWDEIMGNEPPGTTAIHAEKNASMTAGDAAAVYGKQSASLSSSLSASVIGGVSAVVKGLLWTEVASSLGTGITSIKDVEIAAVKGKLEVSAKKEAVFAVEDGPIVITAAKTIVQVNCNDGAAALHGTESGYVGAGKSSGFGMQAKDDNLKLGKANSAGDFESPGIDATASMAFEASEIKIVMQQSKIEMQPAETKLSVGGVSVQLTPAQLKIDAPMIMLG